MIHNLCCAVYADEGAPLYDAYASIRFTQSSGISYIPLFVSIKTREGYTKKNGRGDIYKIVKKVYPVTKSALILLVLLDRDDDGDNDDEEFTTRERQENKTPAQKKPRQVDGWAKAANESLSLPIGECHKEIVSRVISIPSTDKYGLTNVVRGVTRSLDETCVYESHSFAGAAAGEHIFGRRNKKTNDSSVPVLTSESRAGELFQTI